MLLTEAIGDYLRYLEHEQGATATTCKCYGAQLRYFLRWMQSAGYPEPTLSDFTAAAVRRYYYGLADRGLRPRTLRGYVIALRSMGAFLIEHGALVAGAENPATAIKLPKLDAAERMSVSEEEIGLLMEAVERQRNARKIALDRAVISLLVYGGVRRQELLDLYVTDVDLSESSIRIRHGKGEKARTVYVCDACVSALREWLAVRPAAPVPFLFSYDKRRRLHYNGLKSILEETKTRAGLADRAHITPHAFRHAAGTRLLRNGADLRVVQSYLGHSSLQVTSSYLHAAEENVRDVRHLTAIRPTAPASDDSKILRLPSANDRTRDRERRRRIPA